MTGVRNPRLRDRCRNVIVQMRPFTGAARNVLMGKERAHDQMLTDQNLLSKPVKSHATSALDM
jgi:hypothetical protein